MKDRKQVASHLERSLWGATVVCSLVISFSIFEGKKAQSEATKYDGRVSVSPASVQSPDAVIGRLDIPQINLSVPIFPNFDESSFRRGVGHLEGTAMPGGLGNVALAGHRDTYFRLLANIRNGMTINAFDKNGLYKYIVKSTEIVDPNRVQVLDIGRVPELTLITCYPFHFIGAAPKRFIVHAELVSVSPSKV